MNTYTFSRYDFATGSFEFRTVQAKSFEEADYKLRLTGFRLFSISKPVGYHALNINERVNLKANAGLLYTTYNPLWIRAFGAWTERPEETRLILKRVAKRDPKLFSPSMMLDKNTISI